MAGVALCPTPASNLGCAGRFRWLFARLPPVHRCFQRQTMLHRAHGGTIALAVHKTGTPGSRRVGWMVAGTGGLEPPTYGTKNRRSTN